MALHCFSVVLVLPSLSKKTSFSYPEMAEERPCDKVLLLSRRTVNSKKLQFLHKQISSYGLCS